MSKKQQISVHLILCRDAGSFGWDLAVFVCVSLQNSWDLQEFFFQEAHFSEPDSGIGSIGMGFSLLFQFPQEQCMINLSKSSTQAKFLSWFFWWRMLESCSFRELLGWSRPLYLWTITDGRVWSTKIPSTFETVAKKLYMITLANLWFSNLKTFNSLVFQWLIETFSILVWFASYTIWQVLTWCG